MKYKPQMMNASTVRGRACFKQITQREREVGGMDQVCVAPFVLKIYEMVSDTSTDPLVSWGLANNSFVVLNLFDFSQELLPKYFKHNNFSSFVRQLNTYGFRKVDPDRWEFANEHFLRGQKHLLKNIVRRRNLQSGEVGFCRVSLGSSEVELRNQVEKLRYERNSTAMDLAELKQNQKTIDEEMREMNKRLQVTEKRPRQMLAFLAKVIENSTILAMMNRGVKQLPDNGASKKRRMIAAERKEEDEKRSTLPLPYVGVLGETKEEIVMAMNGAGEDLEREDKNEVIALNYSQVSPISSVESGDIVFDDIGTRINNSEKTYWGDEEEGPLLIEDIHPPDYVYEYQELLPGCGFKPPTQSMCGALMGTGFF